MSDFYKADAEPAAEPDTAPAEPTMFDKPVKPAAKGKAERVPIERLHKALNQKTEAETKLSGIESELAKARETIASNEGRLSTIDTLEATVSAYGDRYAGPKGPGLVAYDSQFMSELSDRFESLPDAVREVMGQIHEKVQDGPGETKVNTDTLKPTKDPKVSIDTVTTAPADAAPDKRVEALLKRELGRELDAVLPDLKKGFRKMAIDALSNADSPPASSDEIKLLVGKHFAAAGFTYADVSGAEAGKRTVKPDVSAPAGASVGDSESESAAAGETDAPKYKTLQEQTDARMKRLQGALG